MHYHHDEEQQLNFIKKYISKHTGWSKRRIFLQGFPFSFCVKGKCVARNVEFQFVYLTKAVLKSTSNVIFYMKKVALEDRNWTGKLQVTLIFVYTSWKKLCSHILKASSEEVFVMRSEKMKIKYM